LDIAKGTRFTPAMVRDLPFKALQSLGAASDAVVLTAEATKWLVSRNLTADMITAADRAFFFEQASRLQRGLVLSPGRFEEKAWTSGATVTYTSAGIEVTRADSTVEKFKPSPIPVVEERPGSARLSVILQSLFHIDQGQLQKIIVDVEFRARFGGEISAVDPNQYDVIAKVWQDVLSKSHFFSGIRINRRTVKGLEMASLIVNVLNSCPYADYFSISTVVSILLVRAVDVTRSNGKFVIGGPQYRVTAKGKTLRVPENTIKPVIAAPGMTQELKREIDKFKAKTGVPPHVLTGNIPGSHTFVSVEKPTVKEAQLSYTMGMSLRGGPYHGAGTLLASDGFSSMSSDRHNRMCLLVALALNAVRHEPADVTIAISVGLGEIEIVHNTIKRRLDEWEKRILYVVDGTKFSLVSPALQPYTSSVVPVNAHYVGVTDRTPPTVPQGHEVFKVFDLAAVSMQAGMHCKRYTWFTNIVSDHNWTMGKVFQFRKPWDFKGILTTLSLIDLSWDGVQFLKCIEVGNPDEWWSRVVKANIQYNTYWLAPIPFFNPISNILLPPPRGTIMTCKDDEGWKSSPMGISEEVWVAPPDVDKDSSFDVPVERMGVGKPRSVNPRRKSAPKNYRVVDTRLEKKEPPPPVIVPRVRDSLPPSPPSEVSPSTVLPPPIERPFPLGEPPEVQRIVPASAESIFASADVHSSPAIDPAPNEIGVVDATYSSDRW